MKRITIVEDDVGVGSELLGSQRKALADS